MKKTVPIPLLLVIESLCSDDKIIGTVDGRSNKFMATLNTTEVIGIKFI